ncbi:MAG: response regulator transcription factor [Bacteroidetes bacterium]|nr:response regulator transcription factor [Bacteroidota bacterium]MCB0842451.1 response regulator transcription factor [Bacteroidota bacterium]MCB0853736.1 response regulator transcription factor [Bacteroidota bacterium]
MKTSDSIITAIAVDDEPRALELIGIHAEKVENLKLMQTFRDPLDAIQWLSHHETDVIFLDINMPNLSGLSFRKIIGEKTMIVFTTAYSEFGAESYEQDAVDYLVKPIRFERFLEAFTRVERRKKLAESPAENPSFHSSPLLSPVQRSIFVKSGTKSYRLLTDEILYLEKDGNYVTFHTPEKKVLCRLNMSQVKEILPEDQFVRVHKSYVVNLLRIEVLEVHQVTVGGRVIPVAKNYREGLHLRLM